MYFTYSEKVIIAEYIWLGGNYEILSKTRIIRPEQIPTVVKQISYYNIPDWDYDGSSTGQATTEASEVVLKPCAMFRNPLHENNDHSYLILCSTYTPDGQPIFNNHRHDASEIFNDDDVLDQNIWFGLEFEYMIFGKTTGKPLEYDGNDLDDHYCSINALGRVIVDEHMLLCLAAGLRYDGFNAEVVRGQWEYQIFGESIMVADHSIVAKYLLERVALKHNSYIVSHPKPFPDKNGQGMHTNCSTKKMREVGGIDEIFKAIKLLELAHDDHMKVYGKDNEQRLTGKHETSNFKKFTSGVADRTASIRIGSRTMKMGYGYFEDRRPASNADPYLVTAKLASTIILNRK